MKNKVLLLGAVITGFALTSFAAEPLLTPRAAGNQIKVVASTPGERDLVAEKNATMTVQTPRVAAGESATATAPEIVSAAKCQVIGTPRSITAAGGAARTACCGMTLASCPDKSCCAK